MHRRPALALALSLALAAGLGACAGSGSSQNAEPLRREATEVLAVEATVKSVDLATRRVTLVDASGGEATFVADEAVRNLPQVKPGDRVTGSLLESVVLEVREPTPAEAASGGSILEVAAAAEPGQRPAGRFVRQITAVLTIDAIDRANQTATLRGPAGNTQVVPVRNPANLDRVSVGDNVVVKYTEALQLEVTAPAAK